jgi:hypothetical protein
MSAFADEMSGDTTTEIRFDAPRDVCVVLAAIAKARRMTRNELILRLMHDCADEHCRLHSVMGEAAARNPILAEKLGRRGE